MGERKVLNKYYPPDYNLDKKLRIPKKTQKGVRNMLPMTIRCSTCGNFIYRGTKFNTRKEDDVETYLGIQIYRFYYKCSSCSAEIIMKTDPRNHDYTLEEGATRNFEPYREASSDLKHVESLENKALLSKKEIDNMAALDELKFIKSIHAQISYEQILQAMREGEKKTQEEYDVALIKSIFNAKQSAKRLMVSDDDDDDEDLTDRITHEVINNRPPSKRSKPAPPRFLIKKISASALTSLCQNYEEEEDD